MDWSSKTVWITGASSGIGEALTYQLAKKGAQLILSSRRIEALETVKANTKYPKNVSLYPLDLAQPKSIIQSANEVLAQHKIDLLINNGGVSQRSLAVETDLEVYRNLMEINYFGTIQLSKIVLQQFVTHQKGHFVVVTSLAGKLGTQYRSGYCASKHALHGFFDALRLEHHTDNIKVTMICPGFIKTNISFNAYTKDGSKQGFMDDRQAKGMSAKACAKKMIKAIEKEKQEVYIGKKEIMAVYLNRFAPKLFHRFMLKTKVK